MQAPRAAVPDDVELQGGSQGWRWWGGSGTGKRGKTEGPREEGRCTAPSLGTQQQAGPKRSELLGVT